MKDKKSYGKGLNDNGGGVFATEWTSDHIQVHFFPRGSVPSDVLGNAPNPSSWGKPAVKFEKSGCDINKFFKNQKIIFDTTFCGDWAGNTWSTSSCKSKAATCNAFVQNNPDAFKNAFWDVKALKVYTNDGSAAKPSSSGASKPSSSASASSKPSSAGASSKPASSGASSKPASSGASSKPASSGASSKPASSSAAPKPSSSGTGSKPSSSVKPSGNPAVTTSGSASSSKSNVPHPNTPIGPGASRASGQKVSMVESNGVGIPAIPVASKAAESKDSGASAVTTGKPTKTSIIVKSKSTDTDPEPTDAPGPDEDDEAHIVYKTVVHTVVVTAKGPKATGAAHKRHASLHNRRAHAGHHAF